jgi:ribosome-associated protein
MPTPETRRQLLTAVAACDDKKGEDTRILELDPADSGLADFFLITSATNDRQVVAIADEIEFRLKKEYGLYATSVEGRRQGEWILLDYTDIVIHVFLAEKRAFYDIERLRKSARPLTGPEIEAELKSELARKTLAVRKSTPAQAAKKSLSPSSKKQSSIPTRNMASSKKSHATVSAIQSAKGDSSVSPTKKAAKKAPAKAAKKAAKAPLKSAAKKAPAKAAKKAPIKAAAKKSPAKKAAPKKAAKPAVKAAKKTPAKKAAPTKVAIKKVAAKKAAPIKATVKKAAKKKVVAPPAPPAPPAPMEAALAAVEAPSPDMHGIISQGAKPPVIK